MKQIMLVQKTIIYLIKMRKKMFKDLRPNIVIHLAALVGGVHHNIKEPVRYFEENIIMNTPILRECFQK